MAKIVAPIAKWLEIGGDRVMSTDTDNENTRYAFYAMVANELNRLVGDDDDPSTSPIGYVDGLIIKLKIGQSMLPAGVELDMHVPKLFRTDFIAKMQAETRWRWADGQATPANSWLKVKGNVNNVPNFRGAFLRFWDGNADEETARFQDFAMQTFSKKTSQTLALKGKIGMGLFLSATGEGDIIVENENVTRGGSWGDEGRKSARIDKSWTVNMDSTNQIEGIKVATETRSVNMTAIRIILT